MSYDMTQGVDFLSGCDEVEDAVMQLVTTFADLLRLQWQIRKKMSLIFDASLLTTLNSTKLNGLFFLLRPDMKELEM